MVPTEIRQRLRITYGVQMPLCYASVLDMGRLWERLLRRARIPVAYTQGYHPHPRLQFAMPLPVGYYSLAEHLDVYVAQTLDPAEILAQLTPQCPEGLTIFNVEEVPLDAPSLQALMQEAEYELHFWSPASPEYIQERLTAFMAQPTIPRERARKGRTQRYDLRALVLSLSYKGSVEGTPLGREHLVTVRMPCDAQRSGRPEEILQELGVDILHYRIWRTRLIWQKREEKST